MATTCLSEDSLRLVWGQRADLWSSRNFTNSLFPLLYCSVSFNAATFFHTLFLSFFPFVSTLKLNIPQQQIGGNGGTASVLHSIARFTVVFQCGFFFSFSQWFWACLKHFEAISQMTCFVNIFIQFPFVMQMAVTLSISEKADACWMYSLILWWCGVLTAVSDCNVNCLWWGVV